MWEMCKKYFFSCRYNTAESTCRWWLWTKLHCCCSKQKLKGFNCTNLRSIRCKTRQERGNWNREIKCCEGKPQEVKAQKGNGSNAAHLGHWIIIRALDLFSENIHWQYELCTSSQRNVQSCDFSFYLRIKLIWEWN